MLCTVTQMESYAKDKTSEYDKAKRQGTRIYSDESGNKITERLILNEVFLAEKDPSKTSTYKLFADDVDLGVFQSSGIIVATGTGSSGWLYGARRISANSIRKIAREMLKLYDDVEEFTAQDEHEIDALNQIVNDYTLVDQLAQGMSQATEYDSASRQMYYYVRESMKTAVLRQKEGFANERVKLLSELYDGQLCIDGSIKLDIQYGDTCVIESHDEHRLNTISFA